MTRRRSQAACDEYFPNPDRRFHTIPVILMDGAPEAAAGVPSVDAKCSRADNAASRTPDDVLSALFILLRPPAATGDGVSVLIDSGAPPPLSLGVDGTESFPPPPLLFENDDDTAPLTLPLTFDAPFATPLTPTLIDFLTARFIFFPAPPTDAFLRDFSCNFLSSSGVMLGFCAMASAISFASRISSSSSLSDWSRELAASETLSSSPAPPPCSSSSATILTSSNE
mmetsp:Transcript_11574/g.27700  ORF Transcript_11574/g.27700 Transcript_11574/m.27700 type:complete len:226 (-) Transcript_11574:486-1163(-)